MEGEGGLTISSRVARGAQTGCDERVMGVSRSSKRALSPFTAPVHRLYLRVKVDFLCVMKARPIARRGIVRNNGRVSMLFTRNGVFRVRQ